MNQKIDYSKAKLKINSEVELSRLDVLWLFEQGAQLIGQSPGIYSRQPDQNFKYLGEQCLEMSWQTEQGQIITLDLNDCLCI